MPKRRKSAPVTPAQVTTEQVDTIMAADDVMAELDMNPARLESESYVDYSNRLAAILKATKKLARQESKGQSQSEAAAVYGEIVRQHCEALAAEITALNPEKRIRMLSVQINHLGDSDDVEVRIKSARIVKPKPRVN